MAFYGRITNESQTSMAFDRVYPNRLTMDAMAAFGDGVFASRFVLVEYDENKPTEIQQVKDYLDEKFGEDAAEKIEAYVNLCAEAAAIAEGDEALIYNINYRIDKLLYPKLGRGYDSVVFRKVIEQDGTGYYAMMAELNSVVPTFDIVAEAPSADQKDFKPHFDEDSSNVYYRLHMGTPWQFKEGEIEFNEDGFNPAVSRHVEEDDANKNEIALIDVESGNTYYDHSIKGNTVKADTKRLDINLPGIGNMVATGYDKIYGVGEGGARETSIRWVNASDASYEQTKNHRLIQTIDNQEGLYYPTSLETKEKVGNIASAIRSTFDVIGMTIEPIDAGQTALSDADFQELAGSANDDYIYYRKSNGEFYYRGYEYGYSTDNVDPTTAKKYIQIPSGKLHEYTAGTLYNRISNKNYELTADKTAKPNTMYYALDTTNFDSEHLVNTDQMEIEFTRLKEEDRIYELSKNGNDWILTKPTAFDEQKIYCYVPNKTEIKKRPYYATNLSATNKGAFFTSKNAVLSTKIVDNEYQFNFPSKTDTGVIYDRIKQETSYQPDEYGNPDPSKPVITIELQPAAISEQLKQEAINNTQAWQEKTATVQALINKVLYIWPKENTDLFYENNGSINIKTINNQIINNEAQAKYVWLKTSNGFILQPNRPSVDRTYTTATSFMDEETLDIWQLTGLKIVTSFYKPNDRYWGRIIEGAGAKRTEKIYLKMTEVNDEKPTYDLGLDSDNNPVNIELTAGSYRGVNPGNDDVSTDVYFVPGVLYEKDANDNFIIADTFDPTHTYYKGFETYVAGFGSINDNVGTVETELDPYEKFVAGQRWNINLDLTALNNDRAQGEKIILGRKISKPKFILLKEYARKDNTINGWILKLNRFMGDTEDVHTRDLDTIQGVLNTLKDKIDIIDELQPESTLGTDTNGHIVSYPGTVVSLAGDLQSHIQNQLGTSGSGNVISNLTVDNNTGKITATKKNVGTLAITGFVADDTATTDLTTADTVNAALNKLQAKIKSLTTTVNNNNNADKVQSFESTGTGDYITSLTLDTNKKLSATIASLNNAINSNTLTNYTETNITGSNLTENDTLLTALAKLQIQINNITGGAASTTWTATAPTGTIKSVTAANVADGDTVATAVNKLQAQIANGWNLAAPSGTITTVSGTVANGDTIATAINKLQTQIGATLTSTQIDNAYAKIFRQETAPTGTLKSGWIWIQTSTKYVYFYTGDTWELLNSWQ